jgi:hypothetical protein
MDRFEKMEKAIKERKEAIFSLILQDRETAENIVDEIKAAALVLEMTGYSMSATLLALIGTEIVYEADKKGVYEPQNVEGLD